jgi:hypothetical protein
MVPPRQDSRRTGPVIYPLLTNRKTFRCICWYQKPPATQDVSVSSQNCGIRLQQDPALQKETSKKKTHHHALEVFGLKKGAVAGAVFSADISVSNKQTQAQAPATFATAASTPKAPWSEPDPTGNLD